LAHETRICRSRAGIKNSQPRGDFLQIQLDSPAPLPRTWSREMMKQHLVKNAASRMTRRIDSRRIQKVYSKSGPGAGKEENPKSTRRGRPLPTFASLSASPSRAGYDTPPCDQRGGSPLEPSTNGSPWQATGHLRRS
jgi:hypothetical protein